MNNSVLTATTAPKKLSLADWLALAETLNYERLWGFDAFIKHSSPETYDLTVLTLNDWENLADLVKCDKHWANWRHLQYTGGRE